jgi:pyruvate kinase
MQRSTKIVATIGPSSSDAHTMEQLVSAGIDVVRINFSHGTAEDHQKRIDLLQHAMRSQGRTVAVMADLQGPKIRVGKFAGSKIMLKPGQHFVLDAACKLGDSERVGLDYPELVDDVAPGDTLLLDDGRVVMDVEHVEESEIHCVVRHGTELSNNKGINKQGGGLSAPA